MLHLQPIAIQRRRVVMSAGVVVAIAVAAVVGNAPSAVKVAQK
jgi:hypothetical protein